ncbi:uncharacterized protein MCYG_07815 [Microsporum canis CBS 113480]|uniref:Uncharacterized protein n=1 Tax=Arthroderma otae (strain ATCC MYA-4605 / CBS 113480) TaxID=554155 RepID=C5FXF6_ARTOC|nr:uncharacterized protein MCYG_07815 [Microsporum canis CBS 113480]EEQ34996.1 predicted protein [Microsporum canis CBS 113480]
MTEPVPHVSPRPQPADIYWRTARSPVPGGFAARRRWKGSREQPLFNGDNYRQRRRDERGARRSLAGSVRWLDMQALNIRSNGCQAVIRETSHRQRDIKADGDETAVPKILR